MLGNSLKYVALTLALSCMAGCQSIPGFGASADPDPRLEQEEINVEGSSYAAACVVGASVGLIACALAGSDNKNCYIAAAAAGCGVSMAGNALLDHVRSQYAQKEQQLDALASYIERNNQQASRMAEVAATVYREDKERFEQMQKDIQAGIAQKKDIEYSIARYDANIKVLQENIEGHSEALASYKRTRDGIMQDNQGKLTSAERKKIAECDKKIASLQKDIESIRSLCYEFISDRDVLNLAMNQTTIEAS